MAEDWTTRTRRAQADLLRNPHVKRAEGKEVTEDWATWPCWAIGGAVGKNKPWARWATGTVTGSGEGMTVQTYIANIQYRHPEDADSSAGRTWVHRFMNSRAYLMAMCLVCLH